VTAGAFLFLQFFCLSCRCRYHPPASKRTYFVINRIITKTQSDCHTVSFIGQRRIFLTEPVYSTQQKVTILNRDLVFLRIF